VARVGGDFMHARLVLPGLFSILLPVAALPVRRRVLDVALGAVVVTWALVCALALAPPYKHSLAIPPGGIVDERTFYVLAAENPHPVTLHDYRRFFWPEEGLAVKAQAAARRPSVTWTGPNADANFLPPELPVGKGVPLAVVAPATNVGLFGFAAGRRVWVVDRAGLADPIAARLRLIARGRPGHEKTLPADWTVARFTNVVVAVPNSNPAEVAAARVAMRCGDLGDTMAAITQRMTLRRFARNVTLARRSTALRIEGDPIAAAQQLC
jgi:arabinofuranosyltransferase